MFKRIFFVSLLSILIILCSFLLFYRINENKKDDKLLSFYIDGSSVTSLPAYNYYLLDSYTCEKGSTLTWDSFKRKVTFNNFQTLIGEKCRLNLVTAPLPLVNVPAGSYVSYTGTNGCPTTAVTGTGAAQSAQACSGQNANQTSTTGPTYGYCSGSTYQFNSYGWRLAYVYDSNSDGILEPYLVTAGSPQCITAVDYNSTSTISSFNTASLKYCNASYIYGGACSSTVAYAIKDFDFQQMINQITGTTKTLSQCINLTLTSAKTACGYYSDLFSNGGFYKYAAAYNSSSVYYWSPLSSGYLYWNDRANSMGIRPVVHLKQGLIVTGGNGTMSSPYIISN